MKNRLVLTDSVTQIGLSSTDTSLSTQDMPLIVDKASPVTDRLSDLLLVRAEFVFVPRNQAEDIVGFIDRVVALPSQAVCFRRCYARRAGPDSPSE